MLFIGSVWGQVNLELKCRQSQMPRDHVWWTKNKLHWCGILSNTFSEGRGLNIKFQLNLPICRNLWILLFRCFHWVLSAHNSFHSLWLYFLTKFQDGIATGSPTRVTLVGRRNSSTSKLWCLPGEDDRTAGKMMQTNRTKRKKTQLDAIFSFSPVFLFFPPLFLLKSTFLIPKMWGRE